MSFPLNIYLLCLLGGAAGTFLSLPLWRKICTRTGLVDDPGHRKIHAEPVVLAGGLAVFTGILTVILGGVVAVEMHLLDTTAVKALAHGLGRRALPLTGILGGAAAMLLLGLADDKWELKAGRKFLGQLLIATLVAASGVRITLFVENVFFSYAVTVLWILTLTNACNFMDNMNGLCAGIGALAAFHFAVLAATGGQYLVGAFCCLIAGALLGFLPWNFPKASSFLGDSGSHLVGFLLAVLAILPHFFTADRPQKLAVLSPLLVLAVPLADLVSVVLIRWRNGKPFYVGDNNHFSHRLVRAGCSRTQAVLWLWLAGAVAGCVAGRSW